MNQEDISVITTKKITRDFMEYETARLGPFLDLFFHRNPEIITNFEGEMTDEHRMEFLKILIDKSNKKDYYELSLLLSIPGEFGHHDIVYPVYKGIFYPNMRSMAKTIKGIKKSIKKLYYKMIFVLLSYRSKDEFNIVCDFAADLFKSLFDLTLKMADLLPSIIIYTKQKGDD